MRLSRGTCLFLVILLACLICDFFIARGQIPNADFTQNYREIFAIRDGNLLLKNWLLASDDFYFTDLPFYLVPSLFLGPSLVIIDLAPFLIFACLLITALLIAARIWPAGTNRLIAMFAILFLFGIPDAPGTVLLLDGAIHNATILFALLLVLIAQPIFTGQPFRNRNFIPFFLIAFALAASDPLGLIFCLAPLLVFIALRGWLHRRFEPAELPLAITTIAAIAAAILFRTILPQLGGFTTAPAYNSNFIATPGGLVSNLHGLLTGLRTLFSSIPPGPGLWPACIALIRRASEILVAIIAAFIIINTPARREDGVPQFLVLGAALLLALDACSDYFTSQIFLGGQFTATGTRFIMPAFIFLSLAAALKLPALPRRLRPALWPAGLAAALYFATAVWHTAPLLTAPPAYQTTPEARLAQWLIAARLTYGVGPYWTAELTQALAQNRVIIDPIRANLPETTTAPFKWLCDTTSLTANRRPQFAVFPPDNGFGLTIADITASYGPPSQILDVYGFYLMQFPP
jgi:hypothetical protein